MYNLLLHEAPGFMFNQIHFEKGNLKGSCDHVTPLWGGGRNAGKSLQNGDIVLFSIYFLSNYYKII